MKKDFTIENIDPLGQGVSKGEDGITFIKKTLPGEEILAEITSQKKGVSFANLVEIKKPSALRTKPECPHYQVCNGCDFLHTSYESETEFKLFNIKRSLKFLNFENVEFYPAKERFAYRNRVQLHYDKRKNKIGFLDQKNQIIEIQNCLTANIHVQKKLKEILTNQMWQQLVKNEALEGHIEVYEKDGRVQIAANKNYAHGGFTQVNEQMNIKLASFVTELVKKNVHPDKVVFDLFGGNGNLSKKIPNPTLVVDYYANTPPSIFHQTFMHQDLYHPKAIKLIQNFYPAKPEMIIFDPPRSGVKNLKDHLAAFSPQKFIYIACEFQSFTRDSKTVLENYTLDEVHIFDLFPGTHHFETIGVFTKRS